MDPRILVIEDDPDFSRLLAAHVHARWPGARVLVRDPSRQPLLKDDFDGTRYDLILLDYQLGPLNGLDLLKKFRENPRCPPIIMVTGTGHERLVVQVVKAGAADYIPKPEMTYDVLVAAMEQALVTSPAVAATSPQPAATGSGDGWGTGTMPAAIGNAPAPEVPVINYDEFMAATISRPKEEGPMPVVELPDVIDLGAPGAPTLPELAGYRVVRPLGGSGATVTQLAVRLADKAPVAIKLIELAPAEAQEPAFAERTRAELRALTRIRSARVARVVDAGLAGHHLYVVTEYLIKGSLQRRLATPVAAPAALHALREILEGLQALHAEGIVHRNLKPSNVLVRPDDTLALADLRIVRAPERQGLTTGAAGADHHYASPEQAQGKRLVPASDLYSAGVILFHMLTGAPPYRARTPEAVLHKHASAPLPDLPPELSAYQGLVNRLMAKTPEERLRDAASAIQAVEALAR